MNNHDKLDKGARFGAGHLPTGTYIYRLRAGTETLTKTMTLIR